MKRTCLLAVFLLGPFALVSHAQDKTNFPSDEEVQLLLTQADRSMRQYKPLIDEEERELGKHGAEAVAKDRQVVEAVETAVELLTKQPQGFNSPAGFALFEWLDDATRNAMLCSQTAMSQASMLAMVGKTDDANRFMHLSQACMDASTLIYTVSENAGSLYERYVKGEQEIANKGVAVMEKCTEALKKMAADKQK